MRGALHIFLVLLLVFEVNGLNIENATHSSANSFSVLTFIPLSSLLIIDYSSNSSNYFFIKTFTPLSGLSVDNVTHDEVGPSIFLIVNDSNVTKLISNTSKLYTDFIDSINLSVIVGKNSYDDYILHNYGVGVRNGFLKYKDKIGIYPFNGAVISLTIDGVRRIFIYGNSVEGEVSALRYLKNHKDEFIYLDTSYYLNDIDALSVYDYMHLAENQKWYNTDTKEFFNIVNKSLFGKFEEKIIDVKTNDSVLLRILKLEPKNSEKVKDYLNITSTPLVFSGGLWSNIYSWQKFGNELADKGYNTYLIELTGGAGQDCISCVNYNYSDLVESYWPSMIGTIQLLNNNSQLIYVGHSNGARTGISSLEIYNSVGKENVGFYFNDTDWVNVSMTTNPIKTYFAVGMPGAFDGEQNLFGDIVKNNYNDITINLNNKNETHKSFGTAFEAYREKVGILFDGGNLISLNLLKFYFSWVKYSSDIQPIITNISKVIIITGVEFDVGDGIVTINDQNNFFNNSMANITHQFYILTTHTGMSDNKQIQNIIKDEISNTNSSILKDKWINDFKEK